ncbi:hypothetical protein HOY82DRAFT_268379 [Tuber indicum]|nr:hypothetical protein HOY82DRAFT_268379 [Tuber indicum]
MELGTIIIISPNFLQSFWPLVSHADVPVPWTGGCLGDLGRFEFSRFPAIAVRVRGSLSLVGWSYSTVHVRNLGLYGPSLPVTGFLKFQSLHLGVIIWPRNKSLSAIMIVQPFLKSSALPSPHSELVELTPYHDNNSRNFPAPRTYIITSQITPYPCTRLLSAPTSPLPPRRLPGGEHTCVPRLTYLLVPCSAPAESKSNLEHR